MSNHVSVTGTFQHGFGRAWEVHDDHQPFGGGRPVAAETTVTAVIDRPRMEHRNG